jgi:hypothetical protein
MYYDLSREPPEPGSLLELAFRMLSKRRMITQVLSVRVLVEAMLRPHVEKDTLTKAMKDHLESVFPYIAVNQKSRESMAKEALQDWTKLGPLRVHPMWEHRKVKRIPKSRLQRIKQENSNR